MLHATLQPIVKQLDGYLRRVSGDSESKAILSGLVDQAGNPAFRGDNKIVCTLVGVEQERVGLNRSQRGPVRSNVPTDLNLFLLFACYFPDRYEEALKFLSYVLAFFQGKQLFTPANTPGLPPGVDRLTAELYSPDFHQQSQIWSAIGAKMMPAAIMKLRVVTIDRKQVLAEVPEISTVNESTQPNRPANNLNDDQ